MLRERVQMEKRERERRERGEDESRCDGRGVGPPQSECLFWSRRLSLLLLLWALSPSVCPLALSVCISPSALESSLSTLPSRAERTPGSGPLVIWGIV